MARRRTPYLPVLIVASVLVACAVSKEAVPTFAGKNGKIAFASTRDGKTGGEDIYAMDPGGTAVERLTDHPQGDFEPAWSPDGSRVAFMSYRHGNFEVRGETFSLYTMDPDGTGVERLIDNVQDDHEPDWSPDGSRIAFARYRDGNDEIYAMDPEGRALDRLTDDPKQDSGPAWSPDGNRIAFQSNRGGDLEIYTMNPDGTGLDRITDGPKADLQPAWSPDGKKIAFTSDRHGDPSAVEASQDPRSNYEIYAMDADGTAVERLTNNPWGDFNPDWQPLP